MRIWTIWSCYRYDHPPRRRLPPLGEQCEPNGVRWLTFAFLGQIRTLFRFLRHGRLSLSPIDPTLGRLAGLRVLTVNGLCQHQSVVETQGRPCGVRLVVPLHVLSVDERARAACSQGQAGCVCMRPGNVDEGDNRRSIGKGGKGVRVGEKKNRQREENEKKGTCSKRERKKKVQITRSVER